MIGFYCKYCVGTGKHTQKKSLKTCVQCSGTGIVPEHLWLNQVHTMGGAGEFTPGFGPAPLAEYIHRRKAVSKITRLKASLIRFGLRLKLNTSTTAQKQSIPLLERIKNHVR